VDPLEPALHWEAGPGSPHHERRNTDADNEDWEHEGEDAGAAEPQASPTRHDASSSSGSNGGSSPRVPSQPARAEAPAGSAASPACTSEPAPARRALNVAAIESPEPGARSSTGRMEAADLQRQLEQVRWGGGGAVLLAPPHHRALWPPQPAARQLSSACSRHAPAPPRSSLPPDVFMPQGCSPQAPPWPGIEPMPRHCEPGQGKEGHLAGPPGLPLQVLRAREDLATELAAQRQQQASQEATMRGYYEAGGAELAACARTRPPRSPPRHTPTHARSRLQARLAEQQEELSQLRARLAAPSVSSPARQQPAAGADAGHASPAGGQPAWAACLAAKAAGGRPLGKVHGGG
jgi:hypothetical protein